MDNLIKKIVQIDLNGSNITFLTKNKASLKLYEQLKNYNNIFDAVKPFNNLILLFPTTSDTVGHYISILLNHNTKTINHFDSYGLSPVQELGYTTNKYVKQKLLNILYQNAIQQGWNLIYNSYKLQHMIDGINTCGRWTTMRVRMDYLSNDEFAKLFLNQTMSPDWLITCLTFTALNEDENDEEIVIRSLGLNDKKTSKKLK